MSGPRRIFCGLGSVAPAAHLDPRGEGQHRGLQAPGAPAGFYPRWAGRFQNHHHPHRGGIHTRQESCCCSPETLCPGTTKSWCLSRPCRWSHTRCAWLSRGKLAGDYVHTAIPCDFEGARTYSRKKPGHRFTLRCEALSRPGPGVLPTLPGSIPADRAREPAAQCQGDRAGRNIASGRTPISRHLP